MGHALKGSDTMLEFHKGTYICNYIYTRVLSQDRKTILDIQSVYRENISTTYQIRKPLNRIGTNSLHTKSHYKQVGINIPTLVRYLIKISEPVK